MQDKIKIKGARVNNLKNVDLEIPRERLVVLRDCPVQVSLPWLLIPCMQRDRGVM